MNRSAIIRQAETRDAASLSRLAIETYRESFGHTFSADDLSAHLRAKLSPDRFARYIDEDIILVAEVDETLVGYIQFGDSDAGQELRRLYVASPFQNQKHGSRLMEAALRHPRLANAAFITLDVWEHNQGARRFYERYGFEVIGTRAFTVESGAATDLDFVMARRSGHNQRECEG